MFTIECKNGPRVPYATFDPRPSRVFIDKLWAGLGCYSSSHKPASVAHALRRHLLEV